MSLPHIRLVTQSVNRAYRRMSSVYRGFDPSAPTFTTPEQVESHPKYTELQSDINEKREAILAIQPHQ